MKTLWPVLLCLLWPALAGAAPDPAASAGKEPKPADYQEEPAGPPPGKAIQKYAEDAPGRPQQNFGVQPIHDNQIFYTLRADRLELRDKEGDDVWLWDVEAWIGEDYNKLYIKSEGEKLVDDELEEAQVEFLYSRNIHSFWDLQVGFRHDFKPEPTRSFFALGVQGLAPLWFEVDAAAYLSDDGDLSAALEVEYDLLLSQRLILQPRLETSLALQEVEELNIGSGFLNGQEIGLNVRRA